MRHRRPQSPAWVRDGRQGGKEIKERNNYVQMFILDFQQGEGKEEGRRKTRTGLSGEEVKVSAVLDFSSHSLL